MAKNILNFSRLLLQYKPDMLTASTIPDTLNVSNKACIHGERNHWERKIQIPAYIRRSQWRAKEALARRNKWPDSALPDPLVFPKKPVPSLKVYAHNPNLQTQRRQPERLILSGRMADVCLMLERMSYA